MEEDDPLHMSEMIQKDKNTIQRIANANAEMERMLTIQNALGERGGRHLVTDFVIQNKAGQRYNVGDLTYDPDFIAGLESLISKAAHKRWAQCVATIKEEKEKL